MSLQQGLDGCFDSKAMTVVNLVCQGPSPVEWSIVEVELLRSDVGSLLPGSTALQTRDEAPNRGPTASPKRWRPSGEPPLSWDPNHSSLPLLPLTKTLPLDDGDCFARSSEPDLWERMKMIIWWWRYP